MTVTALVVLALGLKKTRSTAICSAVAAIGLALAIVSVLRLPQQATLLGGMLVITPLTSLFKIICLVLALFTVLLAQNGSSSRRHHGEYLAMILLATIGLMLLVGSEELLMIFIGLELTGLSLYVLTGFDKTALRSAEAGLKYFLFGSTASAFTLFGLSLVYGMCGTTGLAAIGEKLAAQPVQPLLAVGIVMTLIGFAFKVAAAPFHLWAPDAYQGAPIPSAAFIASGSKVASFVVLGKMVLVGFGPIQGSAAWHAMIAGWAPLLAALGRVVDRDREPRRARANECSPPARLLGGRACRLHFARSRRRRTRRFQRDPLLHHHLRIHADGRVRSCCAGAARNRRRRSHSFRGAAVTLSIAGRVYGDLHALARRPAPARGILRQILSFQRRPAARRKIMGCSGSWRSLS